VPCSIFMAAGGRCSASTPHDRLMREYALRSGAIVVGLDYSLSPEAKFPRALNEVVAAIEWAAPAGRSPGDRSDAARDRRGFRPAPILRFAAALTLREQAAPALRAFAAQLREHSARSPAPVLTAMEGRATCSRSRRCNTSGAITPLTLAELTNPLAAPYRADLRGLPPAFLCIAGCDILADSNRAMAARFAAAHVPCESQTLSGCHSQFSRGQCRSPRSRSEALADAARWLREQLTGS